MDHERFLLSKIIQDKTLIPVADAAITASYFLDPTARGVFQKIVEYHGEHGEVPSLRRILKDVPNYNFLDADDEIFSDLIQLMVKYHALASLEDALSRAIDLYDQQDEVGIQQTLSTCLNTLAMNTPNVRDTDYTQTVDERLERYEALRTSDNKLLGIPTGFKTLDEALQGWQKQQLITMVGAAKAGKTTTMLIAAKIAHESPVKPLVISFEMTNEELEMRLDALYAKISHHRLRSGKLSDDEMKRLRRATHKVASMKQFILSNDSMSATTVGGVAAKVDKYKPELLIVDGTYMMQDEHGEAPGSPQALTNITRGLKRLAQNKNIPVIITTQVLGWKVDKKRGITADSIGYSSSFAQDSDAIIGVERTDDDKINKIKIVEARNSPRKEIYVAWDWDTGEFEEMEGNPFEDDEEFRGSPEI